MSRSRPLLVTLILVAAAIAVLWFVLGRVESDAERGERTPGAPARASGSIAEPGREVQGDASRRAAVSVSSVATQSVPEPAAFPGERAPIAGADVELRHAPAAQNGLVLDHAWQAQRDSLARTRTDERGEFVFRAPRARQLEIVARADGYAPGGRDDVLAGADAPVEVVLARAATLAGRVTRKSDGAPVAGAEVLLFPDGYTPDELATRTDAGGNFEWTALAPGQASLVVAPVDEVPRNELDIELVAGVRTVHDVVVDDGHVATGEVRDAVTQAPIAGAEVSSWSFLHKVVKTDVAGRFQLTGLREKPVPTFAVRAAGYGSTRIANPAWKDGAYVVDVELSPGRRARGRVVDADGRPVADAYVAAIGGAPEGRAGVDSDDVHSTRTDAQGAFALGDLNARVLHYLFVRAAGHADRVVPFPGDEEARVEVDLGEIPLERPAHLEAVLLSDPDRLPIANASIGVDLVVSTLALSPVGRWYGRNPFAALHREATTDASGRFAFADLAAGKYRLRAYRQGRRALEGASFELAEGESRRDAVFLLPAGDSIRGRVIDPWGTPVEGAFVSTRVGRGEVRATSAPDGSFELGGIGEGEHVVRAMLERAYEIAGTRHELVPAFANGIVAGASDVVLRLQIAASVAGTVVDENDSGVAHALVEARADGILVATATADAAGRFTLRVAERSEVDLQAFPSRPIEGDKLRRFERVPADARGGRASAVRSGARDVVVRLGSPR